MVRISRILFLVLLWCGNLQGQVRPVPDSIVFSGIVINQVSSLPLSDVTCRYGSKWGTISDETGRFCIQTVRGDTIRFTHVGFKPYVVVIPDSLLEREYMLGVFMSPDTLHLTEALILKRWKPSSRENWVNARNNMSGILRQAYAPVDEMDAGMNQRMMIEDYARSIEMKGHVDVKAGVGTQSLDAYRLLRMQKRLKEDKVWLNYGEIDLLKKLYYIKKKENADN